MPGNSGRYGAENATRSGPDGFQRGGQAIAGFGQADFFRTEHQSHAASLKLAANLASGFFPQPTKGMLQRPISHRSSANYQGTIRNCFGDGLDFFGFCQHVAGADSRASLTKRHGIGIDHSQAMSAEIAHGASRRANVERIARAHEDDDEALKFS